MEDSSKREPRPLSKDEEGWAKKIASELRTAAQANDSEKVHELRTQLIEAAESGTISVEDAINTAFTPYFDKKLKSK